MTRPTPLDRAAASLQFAAETLAIELRRGSREQTLVVCLEGVRNELRKVEVALREKRAA